MNTNKKIVCTQIILKNVKCGAEFLLLIEQFSMHKTLPEISKIRSLIIACFILKALGMFAVVTNKYKTLEDTDSPNYFKMLGGGSMGAGGPWAGWR